MSILSYLKGSMFPKPCCGGRALSQSKKGERIDESSTGASI